MEKPLDMARLIELARYLRSRGQDDATVRKRLSEHGANDDICATILSQLERQKQATRRNRGITLVFIGSIILVIGFIATFFLLKTGGPMATVMYILTTAGIVVLLIGIVDIFGLI